MTEVKTKRLPAGGNTTAAFRQRIENNLTLHPADRLRILQLVDAAERYELTRLPNPFMR